MRPFVFYFYFCLFKASSPKREGLKRQKLLKIASTVRIECFSVPFHVCSCFAWCQYVLLLAVSFNVYVIHIDTYVFVKVYKTRAWRVRLVVFFAILNSSG